MKPVRYDTKALAADGLVKTGAGLLHAINLVSDAAATAGTLKVIDGIDGSGTVIDTITFAAAYLPPSTLVYDMRFEVGLYLDFTTTADVTARVSYR